jgi:hypothetical protein
MTPSEAETIRSQDSLWMRNRSGKGWDRLVFMHWAAPGIAFGQVWDFSGDDETPRLHFAQVEIAKLQRERT